MYSQGGLEWKGVGVSRGVLPDDVMLQNVYL